VIEDQYASSRRLKKALEDLGFIVIEMTTIDTNGRPSDNPPPTR